MFNSGGYSMKKIPAKTLVRTLIPLGLLVIFALAVSFPDLVPFFRLSAKSSKGIGTVSFSVSSAPGKKIPFDLKKVPAGIAPRGCIDIPGGTVVAKPFLMAETETTGALWFAVAERAERKGYAFYGRAACGKDLTHPVTGVSWRDAVVWCNALSEETGLVPAYYLDEACLSPARSVQDLAGISDAVVVKAGAAGFRLSTTDEWELAARYIDGSTWTKGGNPSGSPSNYLEEVTSSIYAVFFADQTAPVRSKTSNALGIYDMSGNVWEWCFDRFGGASADDSGKRVVRGGSWLGNTYRLQVGGEFGTLPDAIEQGQGFRIAKSGW
jgi:formylglycine-generating enzyme required for sulfatase activity